MWTPVNPKGRAVRVDLMDEYKEGQLSEDGDSNPYDFFGEWTEYTQHYAWNTGRQEKHKL